MADPSETISVEQALGALDDIYRYGEPEIYNDYDMRPEALVVVRRGMIRSEIPAWAGRLVVFGQYHLPRASRPTYDIILYRQDEEDQVLGTWTVGKQSDDGGVMAAVPRAVEQIAHSTVLLPASLWRDGLRGPDIP